MAKSRARPALAAGAARLARAPPPRSSCRPYIASRRSSGRRVNVGIDVFVEAFASQMPIGGPRRPVILNSARSAARTVRSASSAPVGILSSSSRNSSSALRRRSSSNAKRCGSARRARDPRVRTRAPRASAARTPLARRVLRNACAPPRRSPAPPPPSRSPPARPFVSAPACASPARAWFARHRTSCPSRASRRGACAPASARRALAPPPRARWRLSPPFQRVPLVARDLALALGPLRLLPLLHQPAPRAAKSRGVRQRREARPERAFSRARARRGRRRRRPEARPRRSWGPAASKPQAHRSFRERCVKRSTLVAECSGASGESSPRARTAPSASDSRSNPFAFPRRGSSAARSCVAEPRARITVLSTASTAPRCARACAGRSTARSTGRRATGRRNREGPAPAGGRERVVPRSAFRGRVRGRSAVAAPPNAPVPPAVVSGRNARETCAPGASESRAASCVVVTMIVGKRVERREAFFVFRVFRELNMDARAISRRERRSMEAGVRGTARAHLASRLVRRVVGALSEHVLPHRHSLRGVGGARLLATWSLAPDTVYTGSASATLGE